MQNIYFQAHINMSNFTKKARQNYRALNQIKPNL